MGSSVNVKHISSASALFQFVTEHFLFVANEAIKKKGVFNVAVSGGSTPVSLFKLLAAKRNDLEWEKVNFFWVDERWVSYHHAESNYGEALRNGLNTLSAKFFPFNTSAGNPQAACLQYSKILRDKLGDDGLDLMLLGAGSDGHTASIFEKNIDEAKQQEFTFATTHPQSGQTRLSLSFPMINKSNEICILLVGTEKVGILKSLRNPMEPYSPIQWVTLNSVDKLIVTDIQEHA